MKFSIFVLCLLLIPLVSAEVIYQEAASSWGGGVSSACAAPGDWANYAGRGGIESIFDSNYSYGSTCCGSTVYCWAYANYSNTSFANNTINAIWQVSDGVSGKINLSIPSVCLNESVLMLNMSEYVSGVPKRSFQYRCWNYTGSSWATVLSTSEGVGELILYEEGVFFNISDPVVVVSSDVCASDFSGGFLIVMVFIALFSWLVLKVFKNDVNVFMSLIGVMVFLACLSLILWWISNIGKVPC